MDKREQVVLLRIAHVDALTKVKEADLEASVDVLLSIAVIVGAGYVLTELSTEDLVAIVKDPAAIKEMVGSYLETMEVE